MGIGGMVLCGVLAGADVGSTVDLNRRIEALNARPGYAPSYMVELGPVSKHGLWLGGGVMFGGCAAGEVIGRHTSKKAKIIRWGATVAITAAKVGWNMRQGR